VKIQDAAGHPGVNKLTLVASPRGGGGGGPQRTEDNGDGGPQPSGDGGQKSLQAATEAAAIFAVRPIFNKMRATRASTKDAGGLSERRGDGGNSRGRGTTTVAD
jgi:hypothetical protein